MICSQVLWMTTGFKKSATGVFVLQVYLKTSQVSFLRSEQMLTNVVMCLFTLGSHFECRPGAYWQLISFHKHLLLLIF